ncbi:MAG: hypothetical protein ACRDG2_04900, partial [Actinomycetota bacterium]
RMIPNEYLSYYRATTDVIAAIRRDGALPDEAAMRPDNERMLMERVRGAERATLAAVAAPSRGAVVDAVASHPVGPSRELAERIVDGYLERHAWMRERYA